ncbi:MAG: CoA transferase [Gammaproteobacteria bacterium]|nr:CoA transferase [Gammaproteobacteria bacterium]
MAGPLEGVRVVDFTTMIAGPYGTMILADQGADVIKVEAPASSDHARRAGYGVRKVTAAFLNNNRNKRSIAIDLKKSNGREIFLRLAETADVFVQNFRPGVMKRLGIDEPTLREINPRLIYVSISGWGETGPYAHKPVYDPIIQALSGLATVQAGSDEARPRLVRTILPDKVTAITATQAICAALFHRERCNEGQHIKLSMLDSVVAFMWSSDMGSQTFVDRETSVQRAATFIDLIYETKSGHISISVMTNDQWEGLCRAVGHVEWMDDERFKTPSGRDRFANERLELTQSAMYEKTADEWLIILEEAGVPCAPVLTRQEMIKHPQVEATGVIEELSHESVGRIRQARNAAQFDRTPTEQRLSAPMLGEHTLEIMRELGYGNGDISLFLDGGTIYTSSQPDA